MNLSRYGFRTQNKRIIKWEHIGHVLGRMKDRYLISATDVANYYYFIYWNCIAIILDLSHTDIVLDATLYYISVLKYDR